MMQQLPRPGEFLLRWLGDVLDVTLRLDAPRKGIAMFRTNVGNASVRRREIIEGPVLARDWHDIPMTESAPGVFTVRVPLDEVGVFAGKTCFFESSKESSKVLKFESSKVPSETLAQSAAEEQSNFRTLELQNFRTSEIPQWPPGGDLLIKVEPAHTARANTVYCAFVRQHGSSEESSKVLKFESSKVPSETAAQSAAEEQSNFRTLELQNSRTSSNFRTLELQNFRTSQLDSCGYTVIPPSGTFRNLIRRLDHILLTMRFRVVQLLPVFPVPTTFARMGRFGSAFAATDFLSVDPALAEFDTCATPMDQFRELVDAVHARGGDLYLDLPANHTGWAATLQTHHPEWYKRKGSSKVLNCESSKVPSDDGAEAPHAQHNFRTLELQNFRTSSNFRTATQTPPGGEFVSPGAWGVTWADLVELDYAAPGLREYMAEVFLFWCRQGVDGFRCDAGYMIPAEAWTYIVARVREEYPDTVFLLEGLGGSVDVTRDLLARAGLNWAYSELFQTEGRAALEAYLPHAAALAERCGPLIHFAETHDNNRLAARGAVYARMRTAMSALLSHQGAFGIANGVEWLATEKIDVHGAPPLNWGAPDNQ
ncbi:MAG: alpha-amylase family glycosyl hydrolase, partial [Kiritimatiellaeota bacterium]|nr:alpha-amylase family glycosyl hydrolase [Kiritimatiellota bacterium]